MNQYLMYSFTLGQTDATRLWHVSQGVVLWNFLPIRNPPTITCFRLFLWPFMYLSSCSWAFTLHGSLIFLLSPTLPKATCLVRRTILKLRKKALCPSSAMDMLNIGDWNSCWSMEGVNAFEKRVHSSICIEKRDFNSKLNCTVHR